MTELAAVVIAVCLYRLRSRSFGRAPLWLRLREMSGGDVVEGRIDSLLTPLGKDTATRRRSRMAAARAFARRNAKSEHRDRSL